MSSIRTDPAAMAALFSAHDRIFERQLGLVSCANGCRRKTWKKHVVQLIGLRFLPHRAASAASCSKDGPTSTGRAAALIHDGAQNPDVSSAVLHQQHTIIATPQVTAFQAAVYS